HMDFEAYAERGFDLANLEPYGDPDDATVRAYVQSAFPAWSPEVQPADLAQMRALGRRLRAAMTADSEEAAVDLLNALLAAHPVSPQISGHGGAEEGWHLHLGRAGVSVAQRIASVTAMGVAVTLLNTGLSRRGTCAHGACEDVYVDVSPGGTRRYCSGTCANRANVAAWRRRRKATAEAGPDSDDGTGAVGQ
ncbi:MAG TPA: CGNR zinc finger domain-containing protein, partial [Euzebya sp.]|nr:CGNR zinc finger domain-containing protein [Euzebya sp.]